MKNIIVIVRLVCDMAQTQHKVRGHEHYNYYISKCILSYYKQLL